MCDSRIQKFFNSCSYFSWRRGREESKIYAKIRKKSEDIWLKFHTSPQHRMWTSNVICIEFSIQSSNAPKNSISEWIKLSKSWLSQHWYSLNFQTHSIWEWIGWDYHDFGAHHRGESRESTHNIKRLSIVLCKQKHNPANFHHLFVVRIPLAPTSTATHLHSANSSNARCSRPNKKSSLCRPLRMRQKLRSFCRCCWFIIAPTWQILSFVLSVTFSPKWHYFQPADI